MIPASGAEQTAWHYPINNFVASQHLIDVPVQVGWLRGVYGTNHTLVRECWLDEIVSALKADPLSYRIQLLNQVPLNESDKEMKARQRLLAVVNQAQQLSQWQSRKKSQQHLGFACDVFAGMTFVAVVVQATVKNSQLHISQLDCVIDCGIAANPDMIKAQFEGGAIWSLSALQNEITIEQGQVVESNFHQYQVPRITMAPEVLNLHIIDSKEPPMGVGEPVVTATMPAMLNAISSLTGTRQRKLPINIENI